VLTVATVVAVEDAECVVFSSTTPATGVLDNHLETEVTARLLDPLSGGRLDVDAHPAGLARITQSD